MEKIINRYFVLIGLLLITTVLTNLLSYESYNASLKFPDLSNRFPLKIGEFKGEDLPIELRVYDILETKSILHRLYILDNQEIFLSIVHYPEAKVDFHAPEACLGGEGIQVSKSTKTINITYKGKRLKPTVIQLIRKKGGKDELFYYFYKADNSIGPNYITLRYNIIKNKLFNNDKGASLIRISTPIVSGDIKKASQNLIDFINQIYPFLIEI